MLRQSAKLRQSGAFKGRNLMTPKILGYFEGNGYEMELSMGTGIAGNALYGVTVARDDKKVISLGACFITRQKAMEYMRQIGI